MITAIESKEDVYPSFTEYYYAQPSPYPYYPSIPFRDDSNHPEYYHPGAYQTNPYFTFGHETLPNHMNATGLNHRMPSYYQQCPPEEHAGETIYEYHMPTSIPALLSNPMLNQSSSEPGNCSTSSSSDNTVPYSPSNGTCQSSPVIVNLVNQPLWMKFASHTHENVITKGGRRMFPTLEFQVSGLSPKAMYDIYVEMVLVDDHHWKFNSGQWIVTDHGGARCKSSQHYSHPDSPNTGAQWMRQAKIAFTKLKLTNNKHLSTKDPPNQKPLLLNSMRKYVPRLTIAEVVSTDENRSPPMQHIFSFPETQFIAVTAYQNTDITQLKIDYNPFAKGFRDSAENNDMYDAHAYGSHSSLSRPQKRMYDDPPADQYEHPPRHKRKRQS